MAMPKPLHLLLPLGLVLVLAASPAYADEPAPTSTPAPALEPSARAAELERAVGAVELGAKAAGLGPTLLARPAGEARRAIERARGAAASGDAVHGAQLWHLASEWLDTARALARAAELEKQAQTVADESRALEQKLERTRDVLTQHQARKQSLLAEIAKAEDEARAKRDSAAASERARLDKAAGKRPAPAPKAPTPSPAPRTPQPGAPGGDAP